MGLFRQPKIKDGIAAQATVVEMSDPRPNHDSATIDIDFSARIHVRFRLRVEVPGQPPYEVKYGCQVKPKKMPHVGAVLPVTVSRDSPEKLRIEWDDAPDSQNNPNGLRIKSPVVFESSTVQVDMSGGDHIPPEVAAMLKAQGIDLQAMVGGAPLPVAPAAAPAGDSMLDALERLTALRDQGVLTDEEFAAQKARVLGGG
ncbi:MAG: SHOCT domain-containing protein [Solirubrobacteraceae bacterium]|nr:SHOCT domain-containing protein [Solirubrobacteraceae bacterium]